METSPEFYHALTISGSICAGCTHCITKCPTGALRIVEGTASIRGNWCLDCAECMKVCPVGAIYVEQNDFNKIFDFPCRVALVPAIFLGQFNETTSEREIYDALFSIGFTHVVPVELSVDLIHREMAAQIAEAKEKPSISPFCPAIVRLIQIRFPELVDNILDIKPPVEATACLYREKLRSEGHPDDSVGLFYISPCAAKIVSIHETDSSINGVLNMDFIYNKVYHKLQSSRNEAALAPATVVATLSNDEMSWSQTSGEADNFTGRSFAVDEIHNVIEFIESMEMTGELHEMDFLELRACDRGCVGGVLTPTNRFLASERLHKRSAAHPSNTELYSTFSQSIIDHLSDNLAGPKVTPNIKLLYQGDIGEVLVKMNNAKLIYAKLPGIDCGACGSPSCQALSEDIVRGEATIENCVFTRRSDKTHGTDDISFSDRVWGTKHTEKSGK